MAAYWKHSSNLPPRIDFNGVQVGEWKENDVKIASLNVDGLDGGKFEELLAYMDTQGLGVLVLQETPDAPRPKPDTLESNSRKGLGDNLSSSMWREWRR